MLKLPLWLQRWARGVVLLPVIVLEINQPGGPCTSSSLMPALGGSEGKAGKSDTKRNSPLGLLGLWAIATDSTRAVGNSDSCAAKPRRADGRRQQEQVYSTAKAGADLLRTPPGGSSGEFRKATSVARERQIG